MQLSMPINQGQISSIQEKNDFKTGERKTNKDTGEPLSTYEVVVFSSEGGSVFRVSAPENKAVQIGELVSLNDFKANLYSMEKAKLAPLDSVYYSASKINALSTKSVEAK
jgi:hypothetical protein